MANPYGAGSAATDRPNGGLDQGLGESLDESPAAPRQPSPYGESYGGASAANPYGAGKPKAGELNGDPLGILGFNPYDAKSLLAPKTRPASPAASAPTSDPLGSTLSSPQ